jgi:hypothetical protein
MPDLFFATPFRFNAGNPTSSHLPADKIALSVLGATHDSFLGKQ